MKPVYKMCSVKLWLFIIAQVIYHIIYFGGINNPDFATYSNFQQWALGIFFASNLISKVKKK